MASTQALAPPGAGRGTQGERPAAWSGARHIAAGDLLRAEAQAEGRLGREIAACQARGDLVPDQIVLDVLTPWSSRRPPVAAELAARLGVTLDAAIYLHAPETVLARRLLDRARRSGRSDDKADVIRRRLRVFAETTGPLVPYYAERGILVSVDADQPPGSVTTDIQSRLSGLARAAGRK